MWRRLDRCTPSSVPRRGGSRQPGGIAIIESETAGAVVEGVSPWLPFFEFDVTPVVDIQAAVPLFQRSYQWRDSVT